MTGRQVAIWMITGVATLALCARLYTRYWRFTHFYWDDFFVILAWILSIPIAVQTTLSYKHNTFLNDGSTNVFLSRPITQLFFYTCLWAVKISFLIFFRRIGICALETVRAYWMVVFLGTVLSYLVLWTLNPYPCWLANGIAKCEADLVVRRLTPVMFGLATAFDILTDCLSMSAFLTGEFANVIKSWRYHSPFSPICNYPLAKR